MKILTLSFDDNVTQDRRFIQLLKKYNLTCTFNLNSALCGLEGEIGYGYKKCTHNKNSEKEICELYKGFEVAVHTRTHPMLTQLSAKDILEQVIGDSVKLSELVSYAVHGMAYPGAPPNYDRLVVDLLEKYTHIKYARTVFATHNFDFPENFLEWHPTASILEDCVEELIEKFDNEEGDCLLYLWGHTYEFDLFDAWERIEKILERLSKLKNTVCLTNMQVYEKITQK